MARGNADDLDFDNGEFVRIELTEEEEVLLRDAEADAAHLPEDLYANEQLDGEQTGDSEIDEFATEPAGSHEAILRILQRNSDPTHVNLAGVGLRELRPESIPLLEEAEVIDLSGNELVDLPAGFGRLTKLRTLYLEDNEFRQLPEEVCRLKNLDYLDISRNPITDLPSDFSKLQKLYRLDMNNCGLRNLPHVVTKLGQLGVLGLGWNHLEDLPAELQNCKSLEVIAAESNGWEKIPDVIWELSNLTSLILTGNSISRVPPEISHLRSLVTLHLGENDLEQLPVEIGGLADLETLVLSDNRLRSIPPTIGSLSNLTDLDLTNNKLTDLPQELAQLSRNVNIGLDYNYLPDILNTLYEQGTSAVLSYLESLSNSTTQFEAKLILVGEGNVGKSTLIAALRGDPFVEGRPTTHGIELGLLSAPHPDLNLDITLNSWDFGGQDVYRITHQFFFSRRALYLLVWKPREGQEQNSIEEWCRRIRLRTGADARIIVVATHAEERRPELDFHYLKAKYPDMLVGNFAVDSESGRGIQELREAIAREASCLPQMGELMSNSWVMARERITSTPKPHMSRLTLERICAAEGLDEESTQTLANLLHDLGHIIYYSDDDGLRDLVVLQPEWLTKAIGYVLEDEVTRDCGGVLEHARLREIWSEPKIQGASGYPEEFHPYFLRLMEKFDITYRLPDEPASLVAQLVPYERPAPLEWEPIERDYSTRRLRLVCRTADEAPGLIAWLTVRYHQFSVGRHWRRGVLLVHERYASQAVLELSANNTDLILTVLGPAPEYFFHLLRDGIEELILRRWKGLGYQFLIPCGRTLKDGKLCTGYFTYQALVRFRQRNEPRILCHGCVEWTNVTSLLTGFGKNTGQIDEVLAELSRVQKANNSALQRIEAKAATTASMVRAALKILSTEVTDSPRLFTLAPEDRSRVIRTVSTRQYFLLTLWCEAPGAEHKLETATYRFRPSKEWVQTVGPYVRVVVRILQLAVPIATAGYGAAVPLSATSSEKADLDFTRVLAEKLPTPVISSAPAAPDGSDGLNRAEGEGLRALRHLLITLDPSGHYGGLRRVRSPSGDLLWVCQDHHRNYDPGLPRLGYTESLAADEFA